MPQYLPVLALLGFHLFFLHVLITFVAGFLDEFYNHLVKREF